VVVNITTLVYFILISILFMTNKKNLSEIVKGAKSIIGFGAVVKYGKKLDEAEIQKIADYSGVKGGDRQYVISVLNKMGRPFDISDATFRTRCLICHQLNNYCCC
jgi:hypothetical protein